MFSLLFWAFVFGSAAAIITIAVVVLITRTEIKKQISMQCPDYLRAKLIEKKNNAVKLKVYNKSGDEVAGIELTSDVGVDNDLKVGELIY